MTRGRDHGQKERRSPISSWFSFKWPGDITKTSTTGFSFFSHADLPSSEYQDDTFGRISPKMIEKEESTMRLRPVSDLRKCSDQGFRED